MRDKETLVFIEVKTRTGVNFGTPSQAVDQKKRERYVKAAAFYLKHKGIVIDSVAVRFDVVEVYAGDLPVAVSVGSEGDILPRKKHAEITVRHIPAAFM